MATDTIHDLFDKSTYHVIAGSTEFFRMTLMDAKNNEPIDLTSVNNIEWLLGSASVENQYSSVHKSLMGNEIQILTDTLGNYTNTIQVALLSRDTVNLQGGFIHQIVITDGSGNDFVPFQGILVFSRRLKRGI